MTRPRPGIKTPMAQNNHFCLRDADPDLDEVRSMDSIPMADPQKGRLHHPGIAVFHPIAYV